MLRLKELYSAATSERDSAVTDNHRLREILRAHGIQFDMGTPSTSYNATMPSYNGSHSGSVSGSHRQDSNTTMSPSPLNSQSRSPQQMHTGRGAPQLPNTGLDYEQLGIDFILTYDSYGRTAYPSPPPGQ